VPAGYFFFFAGAGFFAGAFAAGFRIGDLRAG
jgi:hypothetical protein